MAGWSGMGGRPRYSVAAGGPDASWRSAWPHVWRLLQPRKALLAGGFALMLVNRVCGLVLPTSSKYLIDLVIDRRQGQWLLPILGIVLAATAVQGLTSYALTQSLSLEAQRLIHELRRRVQAHVARLPVAFYDQNNIGTLIARVMSDVEGVRNLLGTGLVQFLGSILTAVIALALLIKINPAMTVVAVVFVLVLTWSIRRSFATIRPVFRERRKINAQVTGRLGESLAGVRVVKAYRAEEREAAVFASGLDRLLHNIFRTLLATARMDLASKVLLGVVGVVIWYMGVHRVLNGSITLGDLVVFNAYLALLVAPMVQIVSIGTQLSEALAGLERTHELLQLKPEDEDPLRRQSIGQIEGRIEFSQVSFAYAEPPAGTGQAGASQTGSEVLHQISFTAEPGTMTALVGPSGSGKSTLIGLVAAFHSSTSGRIRVDGHDLRTLRLDDYRQHLGVVLQDSFLFDGTIEENVRFARPDASQADFLRACRIARVDEFAERFELGYETVVGERGVKLSGGQRQRLSIARAILADPAILILDEATSSLDTESELLIQQGLAHLLAGRTTFVIAHRLSTIRAADQILVLEAGRIVERGTHAELLAAHGRYWELYTRQQGVTENRFLAPGEGGEDKDETPATLPRSGEDSDLEMRVPD